MRPPPTEAARAIWRGNIKKAIAKSAEVRRERDRENKRALYVPSYPKHENGRINRWVSAMAEIRACENRIKSLQDTMKFRLYALSASQLIEANRILNGEPVE